MILDLSTVANFYPETVRDALCADLLNPLMALGFEAWNVVRTVTRDLLVSGSVLETNQELQKK